MGKGGRYLSNNAGASPEKGKKGKAKKTILIVLAVILVLIIGLVIAAVTYFNSMVNLITRPEPTQNIMTQEEIDAILSYVPSDGVVYEESTEETTEAATEATTEATEPAVVDYGELGKIVNVMLVGQSYREGEESRLADTMILFTINRETKTLTLTSFLRDTYVKLPNYVDANGTRHSCGNQRINVNYALGYGWGGTLDAMGMLNQCVYENFGVEVDYNVEIDFESFIRIIYMFDGIEVELTEVEAEYLTNNDKCEGTFTAGLNELDGFAALAYARIRNAEGDQGDITRTNRQRTVINAVLKKVRAMSLSEINDMLTSILPLIVTNMTNEEITTCIVELLPLVMDLTVVSNQCPAEGTYTGQMVEIYGNMSGVLVPDLQANRALLTAITEADQLETEVTE